MFIKNIFTAIYKLIKIVTNSIEKYYVIIKYTPFTIAKYHRKQGAKVGEGCYIRPRSLGGEPYLVKIGNNVALAGGVTFITHDGGVWIFRNEIPDIQVFGPIIIEDNCVIGQNTVLFPNIRIGKNSVVGGGSVVISNIPPNSIAMGVPARVWSSVEKYREKCIKRWKEQRPPDCRIEESETWWNSKHYEENRKKLRKHLEKLFFEGKKTKKEE